MRQIFISHSSSDLDFADVVKNNLEKKGFKVWLDNNHLPVAEIWTNQIDKALRESEIIIVILSQKSLQSHYVTYEWAFALGEGKKVIPLMFEKNLANLHPRIAPIQYLDFSGLPKDRPWDKLYQLVKETFDSPACIPNDAPSDVRVTLNKLLSGDKESRKSALNDLSHLCHPSSIQCLIYELCNNERSNEEECQKISAILEMIGETATRLLITKLLSDRNALASQRAAYALAEIGNQSAVDHLITAFQAPKPDEARQEIARAFGKLKNSKAISYLVECVLDKSENIKTQIAALQAIANIRHKSAVDPLIAAFQDLKTEELRQEIAKTLGKVRDPKANECLLSYLSNSNNNFAVRITSLEAIEEINNLDTDQMKRLLELVDTLNKADQQDAKLIEAIFRVHGKLSIYIG